MWAQHAGMRPEKQTKQIRKSVRVEKWTPYLPKPNAEFYTFGPRLKSAETEDVPGQVRSTNGLPVYMAVLYWLAGSLSCAKETELRRRAT
jgi:hypothetical protein